MDNLLTLGSLFDGSGGFPLGAVFSGILPLWASEVAPFAIRVTTKRLPWMRHLGDIHSINGAEIDPVDIITFGSPCTDMSVAGKRAGLDGKQSVLFYEAIRIIREMRNATHGKYPRFIVWENVPGAFSSNRGEDFRAVLAAIVQTVEPEAEVPAPDPKGWPTADVLLGNGWSVAYRAVDAQYFGVAQRRRRIYLIADFGGERAGEILFEREGVSRDFTPGFPAGEAIAGHPADRAGTAVAFEPGAASRLGGHCWTEHAGTLRADAGDNQTAVVITGELENTDFTEIPLTLKIRSGCEGGGKGALVQQNQSATLSCNNDQTLFVPKAYGVSSLNSEGMKSDNPLVGFYEAKTARTIDQSGGNPTCNQGGIAVCEQGADVDSKNLSVAYTMTTGDFTQVCREQSPCLQARDYKDPPVVGRQRYTVRRLTPTECARLQGFPDGWCDGLGTSVPTKEEIDWWSSVFETHRQIMGISEKPKSRKQIVKWLKQPYSDAAEYKLWGNGVALPCVCFVLRGIVETVREDQAEPCPV